MTSLLLVRCSSGNGRNKNFGTRRRDEQVWRQIFNWYVMSWSASWTSILSARGPVGSKEKNLSRSQRPAVQPIANRIVHRAESPPSRVKCVCMYNYLLHGAESFLRS